MLLPISPYSVRIPDYLLRKPVKAGNRWAEIIPDAIQHYLWTQVAEGTWAIFAGQGEMGIKFDRKDDANKFKVFLQERRECMADRF